MTLSCVGLLWSNSADAYMSLSVKSGEKTKTNSYKSQAANCAPSTGLNYLNYNNVNALLETGGSMWQNRSTSKAAYEIPSGSEEYVIYSGGLWIGGEDVNNQLKIAAIRFRNAGNDYWTGPLTTIPGTGNIAIGTRDYGPAEIDPQTCLDYDQFYITERQDIEEFNAYWICSQDPDCNTAEKFEGYQVPSSILNWPAHGDIGLFQDYYLAPFYDRDGDGVYNPTGAGDYPWYDLVGDVDCRTSRQVTLFGDYNMWWVFNDKGNIHTETNGDPIGMEIHAQAFAFATNDEVNNMTFYNYEMVNRSTQTLTDTYFGVYTDADIGCAGDDYVGCDVQRGLAYAYNGASVDNPGTQGISCTNPISGLPPAIGIDYFEGPYQDNDGLDNPLTTDISLANANKGIPYKGLGIGYGDAVIDNERFGMRGFMYYSNVSANCCSDPSLAISHYNYLKQTWLDGTHLTYGGDGHGGSVEADYAFPGSTDPYGWGTDGSPQADWSESGEGNLPGDRRLLQSAGPFTLEPGALNNITIGVVYGKASSGDPFESVKIVQKADDKAQALFDNCFKILNGPDAPDVTIQELDKEVILYLSNDPNVSNNAYEQYVEKDPVIEALGDSLDAYYRFQGYQIYQVVDNTVSVSELNDIDRARLVAQVDLKDGIGDLVNYDYDDNVGAGVPQLMVDASDEGIQHSFKITDDAFAQGETSLINHKKYYYIAIAYGYNNYSTYPDDEFGQQKPYKAGRKSATGSIQRFVAIPHIPNSENGGTVQNAAYGDGPEITRLEGRGNSINNLELTEESESDIVSSVYPNSVTYVGGAGPVNIKVIDPLNVRGGDYTLVFQEDNNGGLDSARWYIVSGADTVFSDVTIAQENEQIIPDWGISVTLSQFEYTQYSTTSSGITELLTSSIEFADSSKQWLTGVADTDGASDQNWIRSGTSEETADATQYPDPCDDPAFYNDKLGWDDQESFEKVIEGTWAPALLVAAGECHNTPFDDAIGSIVANTNIADLSDISSVDIVITSDRSKWTRAMVVETQDDPSLSWDGATDKLDPKLMPSVDKYGNPAASGSGSSTNPEDPNYISDVGMGWFPGYAIDVATGERLNIAYGEDSWLGNEGGKDMMFNPSGNMYTNFGEALYGGKHYVYVFQNLNRDPKYFNTFKQSMPAYDNGEYMRDNWITANTASFPNQRKVWGACKWVGIPMLSDFSNGLEDENDKMSYIETDVKIKIRVAGAYEKYAHNGFWVDDPSGSINEWNPMYSFNMDDIATETDNANMADSALALINVVPNPYYAYSNYELDKLDKVVKITNLPDQCTINIYTVSGTLVRTFEKDSPITDVDWDLTNYQKVPIASGMYIIHVDVPGVGERVLKWFGVVRPPDFDNY